MELNSRHSPVSGSDIRYDHKHTAASVRTGAQAAVGAGDSSRAAYQHQPVSIELIRDRKISFDDLAVLTVPSGPIKGGAAATADEAARRLYAYNANTEIGCFRGKRCMDITRAVLSELGGTQGVADLLASAREADRQLAAPFLTLGAKGMGTFLQLDLQYQSIAELNAGVQAIGRMIERAENPHRQAPSAPSSSSSSPSVTPELLTASMFEVERGTEAASPPSGVVQSATSARSSSEPEGELTESLFLTASNPDAQPGGEADAVQLFPAPSGGPRAVFG